MGEAELVAGWWCRIGAVLGRGDADAAVHGEVCRTTSVDCGDLADRKFVSEGVSRGGRGEACVDSCSVVV